MKQQILRGAKLGNAVVQDDDVRVEIRCDYTGSIREEMGWDEPGPHAKMIPFDNEEGGGLLKIAADQRDLEGINEIAFSFDSASGFRCVRCNEKGKDSTRLELRFHIRTTDPGAVQLCQEYKRTVKKGFGQMWIGKPPVGEEQVPPLLQGQSERIGNAEGMAAGKRGRGSPRKEQLAAAVAAGAPTVTIEEDDEREQLGAVLAQALDDADEVHSVDWCEPQDETEPYEELA